MSNKHPVVVVTGSSGAGTTTVKRAFEHIFNREGISALSSISSIVKASAQPLLKVTVSTVMTVSRCARKWLKV